MKQLDPNDLLIFARVAEAGSFSRAAERLSLPRSTVSRRVAWLEECLGERVLLRTTRRLALTEFGEQLLAHAQQVAVEVDAATALSEHRQALPSGRLRVSLPADVANLLLTDMLAAFMAMHPNVSLELDLSPRRVDLLGEHVDVAVRVGSLPDDSLLAARRLADVANGLYAAPGYLTERGEPGDPDDLARHDAIRLLGRNGEPVAWTLSRQGVTRELHPPARATANSPETLMRLAIAGAGIALVPDYFAVAALQRSELRRVLPEWCPPSHTVWAVFPGRRLMPAKTRAFIDMLHAALSAY